MKFLLRFSSTSWRAITAGYYRSCWGFHISYHYRTLLSRHYLRRGRLHIISRASHFLISVFIRLAAAVQPRPDFHISWKSSSFAGWMQPQPMITFNLYLAFECEKTQLLTSYSSSSLSWSLLFLSRLHLETKKKKKSLKHCKMKCLLLLLANKKMLGQYFVNMNVLISRLLYFQSITNKSNEAS